MGLLSAVVLPVFLVIGAGYLARWKGGLTDNHVDGLMVFAQQYAIPVLLFLAIARLDLGADFDLPLLFAFYAGSVAGFVAGFAGGRWLFGRPLEDSVAFGFVGLFSNSLLLGLPITERAFGSDALGPNYAIIAIHAPFCYAIGITAMELVRARGTPARDLPLKVGRAIFSNALIIGIGFGFAVNLTGLPLPQVLTDGLDLLTRAALPAALFGLGGVLYRYRPEGDIRAILFLCAVSLVLHPVLTYGLGLWAQLDLGQMRSAVVTASMAPGVNAYLFANMYGVGRRVAASTVLIGTAMAMLSVWGWLTVLP